jgi:hypothetical protein
MDPIGGKPASGCMPQGVEVGVPSCIVNIRDAGVGQVGTEHLHRLIGHPEGSGIRELAGQKWA